MFGVVQGGGPAAGVAAPFANPSSHPSRTMAPKGHNNVQHNKDKQHTTLASFRDDTRLVALRYDQTVALEPPIPLPPPRSPLRPPPRTSSFNLALHPPVVSAPPVPPPRPPPPTEQHPALRTISTPRSLDGDGRRDSVNASTVSYRSYGSYAYAYYEADSSDEEDDPFAYEKIDAVQNVRPLQLRSNSTGSSIYSLHERERIFNSGQKQVYFPRYQRESERDFEREKESTNAGEGGSERVSEADSRPSDASLSPALSISSSTASPGPASPATPPPQFSKRFARSFSLRSGSHKSKSSSSSSSMKRLRKKSQNAVEGNGDGIGDGNGNNGNGRTGKSGPTPSGPQLTQQQQRVERYTSNTISTNTTGTTSMAMAPSRSLSSSSSASTSSPPLPLLRSHSRRAANPIHATNPSNNDHASPSAPSAIGYSNVGPASPVISTTIPCESFFEEDDLSKLSFSIRGSLIFGGKRPWRSGSTSSHKMAERDVILEQPTHASANTKTRVFPLVPSASKKDHAGPPPTRPPRDDDMGVAAMISKPFKIPESPHHQSTQLDIVNENTSTSHKLPPSIRVISAEAEKESQKVRSLYESGEALQLGDGDVPWPLEPPPEVPSDVDANDARPNDQLPGNPIQTSASTSSPVPQGNHTLAGGIEDWEGVRVHDVDRYGFIVPRNPGSPPNTATGTGSSPIRFSSRKHRNVLIRKDGASLSLSAKRGPTKKMSARSLNTHTSEFSVLSRRSVRSTIRQATNKLPHNKDRRLIDEAGDLLAIQPGLSHIAEYEAVEKLTAELKRKEVKRTEKWRKMAKIVRPGSEGQGTVFQFDAKNPKLIERTWKGIPDCWRSAAWYSFLASSAKADPINYVSDEDLTAAFRRLVDEPSPDDIQIDLDVPRTINQHIMFRRRYRGGQRLLFRVLHALSLYFPETGYVQGMAPLATTLLSYYDEEQCFIMLVRLWQFRGLNRIYQSGFVELMGALKDFETYWLNEKDVAEMLRELCIDPTAYATRWYLTLFNLSIPFPVQLRIWDVFMLLGSSPPDQLENSSGAGKEVDGYPSSKGLEILHAASLAIIDTLHTTLVDSDFENAMKSLTSWVPIKDEQKFLEVVQIEWKKHQTRQKKKA